MKTVIVTNGRESTVLDKVVVKQAGETVVGLPFKVFFGEVYHVVELTDNHTCTVLEYRKWSFSPASKKRYTYTVGAGDTLILADVGLLEGDEE